MSASQFDDSDPSLLAESRPGDNSEPLSVTDLSRSLKRVVEDRFGFVRLRGELSGVKRAASGHLYCSIKDEKSVIDGVMWKSAAPRLAFRPEDGVEVIASGKITTYAGRSKYQIVIERMELAGEGALLALLEKTKARLEAEGLFTPERKKPLPFLPRTIGVVTSPTGAVIRDILHRLSDRFPSHVIVWPVVVQGETAKGQVSAAVRGFNALEHAGAVPRPDLLIVARGGGSIEDLWAFNEEEVVRAIAESEIPVISAVGHETDTTLADFAADHRAPTPTAAAERAVPVRAELASAIADLGARQMRCASRPVTLGRERLEACSQRLPRPEALLQASAQALDEATERHRRALVDRVGIGRAALDQAAARLTPATLEWRVNQAKERLANARLTPASLTARLERATERLGARVTQLRSLDPDAPLKRGYAMVFEGADALVRSAAEARAAGALSLKFADGRVAATAGDAPPAAPPAPRPKSKRKSPPPPPGQGDLF
ncbi:exodeoxyribonuclease VII large subunit [Alteriqipengyuania lutimaris]|uniref:Exodeoxyribonuclease 7 large subunit n=1 Tax=Alteriqipengyuania lutimaris TaxID=1538146 RepID=A0A395LJH4_9SPHN|nr:exodeoxyribonuclease VII large subunit [Alteriqipengyuania lutimaris]MBB3034273.1 exodeoxyribonuclease VII large subunit [Alteriqipengyuania lutimaris]RDS76819.1 exodeoxyribonuclease VII large subunit [Alteriqipengyuania lutimaris]